MTLSKYVPQLPFQASRLLYRDASIDQEIGRVVVDYLRGVGRQLHDWGDHFSAVRELDDGNVPQLTSLAVPRKGSLFLLQNRWPVLLRYRADNNSPDTWILSTLPVGPTPAEIVQQAVAWYSLSPVRSGFAVWRAEHDERGYQEVKLERMVPPDRSGWYVVPEEAEEVRRTVRFWLDHQKWFQDRGMPWRLGVELEGPPGTGKSTLVKVLAQELGVPLIVVSPEILEHITDWGQLWSMAVSRVRPPLLVLIEDFDLALRPHVLEGLPDHMVAPSSRRRNSRTTLSAIMNLLDGVSTPDGVCFFVTTNNPGDVEQAAVRPGRIDRVVHIGVASERVRRELARRVLLGFSDAEVDAEVRVGEGETAAAFRLRCQKLALAREMAP